MKKCLVTGGSGFVGIALVRRLVAEGCEVTIYDLNAPEAPDVESRVTFVRGDVRDAQALLSATSGIDSVFHIAAMVPLTRAGKEFWEVNVGGTENAVNAALAAGAEHLVHLSSSAIYGIPSSLPIDESTPPTALGRYGHAKLAGEQVAQQARERGLAVAVIRPRTIIGPGRLGIFDILFEWIHDGTPIFMLGAADKPFQLVSNRDMAEVMVLASRRRASADFNVGTDRFATMRDDLNALAEQADSRSRLVGIPAWLVRPGLQLLDWLRLSPLVDWHYKTIDKEFWFDISKARAELGWSPRDSNLEMLTEAYRSYVSSLDSLTRAGAGSSRSVHRSPVARGLFSLLSRGQR